MIKTIFLFFKGAFFMDIIKFFEKLATHSHHKINSNSLTDKLPVEIKNAYLTRDTEALKSLLSGDEYLANESHVVQIKNSL